jgi:hypothetical protein
MAISFMREVAVMNPKFKPQPWQLFRVFQAISKHSMYLVRLRNRMIETGFGEADPLRSAVETAFQKVQDLKPLLSAMAAEKEFLPGPSAFGSGGIQLTNDQCRQIAAGLFPLANYVQRLQTRFTRRRLNHDDPLFKATAALQAALQDLRMKFTYRSCKKETGPIIPNDDPRIRDNFPKR